MNVIDLHCDLLSYLACSPDRTPYDPISRASFDQLKAGNVTTQILAISAVTDPLSLLLGLKELEIFQTLTPPKGIRLIPAFENASSFSLESEPLDLSLQRLEKILTQITPLYISLTWNGENRFGGGCGAKAGLKPDGMELLQFLSGKNIAIDFSHTSDFLAHDILDYIEKKNLHLLIMASHCNFRAIHNHRRNLPDEIAKIIIQRKGIIGLVFWSEFLESPKQLNEHIEYGLSLGGEDALAFGGDFFCKDDFSSFATDPGFFPELANSSCYPSLLKNLQISKNYLEKIASKNANSYIEKINLSTEIA